MISRRAFLASSLASTLATGTSTLGSTSAMAHGTMAGKPDVTLKLHHFLPATTTGQKFFMQPWADRIFEETQGQLKIEIFPSMQLGGKPPQLYDQARDGVVDMVWTLPGYMPGRFPLTETFELPFIADRSAQVNARALAAFAEKHLQEEFSEVKPLCFWTHDHGVIHANRQISSLETLKGAKLRFPTRMAGEALKALGASVIGMPVPQVPESLAQGVIDGAVLPWEVVPSLKVQELVKYHTEVPGSPALYTATFVLVMNKGRFEALPKDFQQVIEKHSGMAASEMAGAAWDAAMQPARELALARGNQITVLSEAEAARWRETTRPVIDDWLKAMKEHGHDGEALLADAVTLLEKYRNG